MLRGVLVVTIFLGALSARAEAPAEGSVVGSATEETTKPRYRLEPTLYYETDALTFTVSPNDSGTKLSFKPNAAGYVGVGVRYDGLALGWGFPLPKSSSSDTQDKGTTGHFDFFATYSFTADSFEGYYQKYSGFYEANEDSILGQRPDVQAENYGLNYKHIFSPNDYRLSDINDFQKPERRYGWSWLVMASYNHQDVGAQDLFSSTALVAWAFRRSTASIWIC